MKTAKYHFMLAWLVCCWGGIADNVISINKPIIASSQYDAKNWPIRGAVDGNNRTDGNACQCCAATTEEYNPWLRVDLGGVFYITYIKIYGRTDEPSPYQLFHGLQIEAGNGSIINVPDTDNYYESGAMRVGPATYVKLQLKGNGKFLIVCELQVFGECADGYTETDTSCQTVCPAGTYGANCANICGQCRNGANCNPIDGVCQQCEDGFSQADKTCKTLCPGGTYGKNCSDVCGYCRNGLNCSQTNGTCESCEDGYTHTEPTCKTRCLGGTYGYNCTETCGECRYGLACNTTNGVCEGCEDGFHETDITCKTPCKYDTYGHNCTGVCGNCKNGTICNKTNGVCDQCEEGYMETDMLCVEVCSNGTYGQNCSKECGHCSGGEVCRQSDGFCSACVDGYMYTEEDTTCKTGAENVSKPSSSCSNPPDSPGVMMIVGVTVATMLAIEGAAVVIIRLIRKRKSLRNDNVGEPNPYELPDRSINEDEHQYDSAMDMNDVTPNYANTDLRAT